MSRKLSTFRMIVSWIGIAFAGTISLPAAIQETPVPVSPPAAQYRALLNRYCVTCHSERLRTAELTLEKIDVAKVSEDAEVWEKVIRKLRTSAMPPSGLPRPDPTDYDSFATYLEDGTGPRSRGQSEPRQAVHPAPEPHRIRERDPRPARG